MLRIAIQSKGRLNEESLKLLNDADMNIDINNRRFLIESKSFPLNVLYLRDDDIPMAVENGIADIGIVGLNEVYEREADVEIVQRLGFGGCRLSLAISCGEEYTSLDYFNGKRIATSYPTILNKFLKEKGITAELCSLTGSVEIAPTVGMSDAIFDIVSSGGTLVRNNLVEVERVLESEAVIIANKALSPEKQTILNMLKFRIETILKTRGKKYMLMNIPNCSIPAAIDLLPAMRSPTLMPLAKSGWSSLHTVVDEVDIWDKIARLKEIGAEGILVLAIEKIIE